MLSKAANHEVLLGKGLAKILKADLEDEIVVLSQGADGSIANDMYKIVGILDSGDEISDRASFYLHIKDAQELLVLEGRIHEIAVTVKHLRDVDKVTGILQESVNDPRLAVDPWQVFARSFYVAMKADKEGMWIMLVIIVLVVAVGVLNTVLMSVLERRREYGVLKAVGTKPGQIVKMVLAEVNILAVVCIIFGAAVGLLLNYLLSIHGLTLPEPISYGGMKFQYMQAEINARSFYIPTITVLLVATLVSLFPAFKAAKTEPARSMRIH
jgi:ABC-type lipoprotein release transport system permease subunit